MIKTTLHETTVLGNVYGGALRGAFTGSEMRFASATMRPTTGVVRPWAVNAQATHVDNGIKDGVCVRTWSPPV